MGAKSGKVLEKRRSLLEFSTRTFHVKRLRVAANIKLITRQLLVTSNCRDSGFQFTDSTGVSSLFRRECFT
jgi:hypothetical protein